jgi:DNA/RNA endonuclease G (NUC1)
LVNDFLRIDCSFRNIKRFALLAFVCFFPPAAPVVQSIRRPVTMKLLPSFCAHSLAFLATAAALFATIGADLQMQLGNPSGATADTANHTRYLIQRAQYALDYNDTTREPNWVSWDLTAADVGSSGRSASFFQDTTLPAGFYQVLTTDYSGSGYDRGHMCPSADRTVTTADNEFTFYMSNMIPQSPDNNQGVWASFETYCRTLAAAGNEVLITSGPSGFAGSTVASGVSIPGYTWKIAVVVPAGPGTALSRIDATTRVIAIKIPNIQGVRSDPWENYLTSVAQIQSDTGYAFFSALSAPVAAALRTKVDGQTSTGSPVITVQPVGQSAGLGGAATFSVSATGDGTLTYQWAKDAVDLAGATAATLSLTNIQLANAGTYTVVVANALGSVTSAGAALVISGLPPAIVTNPVSKTVSAGSTVTFAVMASGSPTLAYQWRRGGVNLTNTGNITGAGSATLTLSNVQAADATGAYDVVVTNSVSSATSAAVTLTVNPAAPTIVTQPSAQVASGGGSASFTVLATGTAPLTYAWRKGGVPIAGNATAATASLLLSGIASGDAGSYDVVVSNGIGSDATSAAAALTVNAAATGTVLWNFATATPTSGLPSDVTGATVTQNNNNGTTTMLTTTSASSGYTGASGTSNAGAAARTGVLNPAASGSAYFEVSFTPAAANKFITISSLSFGARSTSTGPQAYAIYSSTNGYASALATGTLLNNSVWALITPALTAFSGDAGATVTLRLYGYNGTGSATAGTANWRIDDLSIVLATTVATPTPPTVTSTTPANGATAVNGASPITVTFDQSVTLGTGWFAINSAYLGPVAATVTGGPKTFTLTPPANFADGDTVTVRLVAAQIADVTGVLHAVSDTTFSFTTAAAIAPTITTEPVAHAAAAGSTTTFTVAASGTAPFSYQWRKGGAAITGNASATTATLTLTNVQAADAASYDVIVSNGVNPAATSAAAALTVTPTAPAITTQPVGLTVIAGSSATFTVAASGTTPFTYQWRKAGVNLVNGTGIAGATTATLTLTNLDVPNSGSYDVVVGNGVSPDATSTAATLAVTPPPAGPQMNFTGTSYRQNFDTLPLSGTFTFSGNGPFALDGATPPAGVGATGLPGWSFAKYAGTGASAIFRFDNGASNSGGIDSYGTTSSTDRALGSLGSGSTVSRFGLSLVNTTGQTIGQVSLSYTGEQWRRGSAAANKLAFAYAVGGVDINYGAYTAVTALDFTAPVTTGSNAVLDGNAAANRVTNLTGTLTNLNWAPGQTLVLRWTDADDSGSDDGLAIDDFILVTSPVAQTSTFAQPAVHYTTDQQFTLGATSDSGLPVTYTIVSGPATVSGSTVTLNGTAGSVVVRASQAGNAVYLPAADVLRTITVNARGPQLLFGDFGGGGLAVHLAPDGQDSTLIGYLPGSGDGVVLKFRLNPNGTFSATTTPVPNPNAAVATESRPPAARSATAASTITLAGQISAGALSGTINELGLSFTATLQPDTGTAAGLAGFYQAALLNSASGTVYSVVSANGNAFVLVLTPGYIGGGGGAVGAGGTFTISTSSLNGVIAGTLNPATTSVAGTLTLPGQPAQSFAGLSAATASTNRLINLATRGFIEPNAGGRTMIIGFVVAGTESKPMLFRAIGPSLGGYGIANFAADPQLRVYDSTGHVVVENDDWGGSSIFTNVFAQVGAFGLVPGSKDAAATATLAPGAYTMHVFTTGAAGLAIGDIYDASGDTQTVAQRLVNVSMRGPSAPGDSVLIAGFVVTGNSPKRILIRGAGPALAAYGVTGTLADPFLRVYSSGTVVAQNDNWETPSAVTTGQSTASAADLAAAAVQTGAFALTAGSKDAALMVTLAPGAYTVQVSGAGATTGIALVEVYEIPQ